MKKSLIFLIVVFLATGVGAIPNPATVYCEQTMGYTANLTNCIFPDENSCELWAFYNGSCGEEYVLELGCVGLGSMLLPGKECCNGFDSAATKNQFDENCDPIVGGWSSCLNCGDGICDEQYEDICSCPKDCKQFECMNLCGNNICEQFECLEQGCVCYETEENCPNDCLERICLDLCGDGECQEVVCQGENCPCAETKENCFTDCTARGILGVSPTFWTIILVIGAGIFIYIGLKILKWLFWSLAILAVIIAIAFWFFL